MGFALISYVVDSNLPRTRFPSFSRGESGPSDRHVRRVKVNKVGLYLALALLLVVVATLKGVVPMIADLLFEVLLYVGVMVGSRV
ncbi:hypothetical protein CS0771_02540 [Catellatospora sp. IY07-71]|nr:hypothetical protein CS0771_02540 [Catellatospora sp. IY07-71]